MDSFLVDGLGGKAELKGSVSVEGAKNATLPLMAAALLVDGDVKLSNVPHIADVLASVELLEQLGAYVTLKDNTCSIRPKDANGTILDKDISKKMRASILFLGSVLTKNGKVSLPHPGGCVLGSRPIDLFIKGFEALGAVVEEIEGEHYTFSIPNGLSGGEVFFNLVSVTATETFMIAGTKAAAPVTLKNCAMEPEVVALADFINACGGRVEGAGTPTIVIHPAYLSAPENSHPVIPDRIEAGSFIILGALAGKEVTITDMVPEHVEALLTLLKEMGVAVSVTKHSVTVSKPDVLKPASLRTHEYPGFPTDLQAPMMILLTQASGESSVLETIFDGRLNYVDDLVRMGADIQVWNPHKATVKGASHLKARNIDGPDIRAGLAFLLAGAIAEGQSKIGNAHLIDRGYERIEEKLSSLGLGVKRVKE